MHTSTSLIVQQQIISEMLERFRSVDLVCTRTYPTDINRLLKYIHAHLFKMNLKVEEIKKECSLTNNNVTTKFRLYVGLGIRQYLVHKRLRAAAFILRESNVLIYLIADAVGYTNEYFSKLFKKVYGCSPSTYRQNFLREKDKKKFKEK